MTDDVQEEVAPDEIPEVEIPEEAIVPPVDYGSVTVFFHTGGDPVQVQLPGSFMTLTDLRSQLRLRGRNTDGLAAIVNGQTINADYEGESNLQAGSVIVFSGSVKGG